MSNKILSVILVSKNNHIDVKHTLDSLHGIEKIDYELLVIDSSNSPLVRRTVEQYPHYSNLKYYWIQPKGIYNAMNFGLKVSAKTSYIWFLNPGDTLTNFDCVHKVLEKFSASNIDYCVMQSKYSSKPNLIDNLFPKSNVELSLENFVSGKLSFSHQATFVDKKVFDTGIVFDENYKIAADYKLQYMLIKYFKGEFISEFAIEVDVTGISHRRSTKTLLETTLILFKDSYFSLTSALRYFVFKLSKRIIIALRIRLVRLIKWH
jgi:hypothetical protein